MTDSDHSVIAVNLDITNLVGHNFSHTNMIANSDQGAQFTILYDKISPDNWTQWQDALQTYFTDDGIQQDWSRLIGRILTDNKDTQ